MTSPADVRARPDLPGDGVRVGYRSPDVARRGVVAAEVDVLRPGSGELVVDSAVRLVLYHEHNEVGGHAAPAHTGGDPLSRSPS